MRNTQLRSSPVERFAVEVAASVVVVPRETTVASFPIPPTPEDSRPEADDSVSTPPDAVATSPPQVLSVSESGYPRTSVNVEASPLADPDPTSAW